MSPTLFAVCSSASYSSPTHRLDCAAEMFTWWFLLVLCALKGEEWGVHSMSSGPLVPAACATLTPQHNETSPQSDDPPTSITVEGVEGAYVLGATLTVNLTSSVEFRGFMIQVRAVGSQQPLGTFSFSIEDFKYKTLTCSQEADSVSHANASLVSSISNIQWRASSLPAEVTQIAFYYTVVENFTTYWVLARSEVIPIAPDMTTPTPDAPTDDEGGDGVPLKRSGAADILVRLHGSLMAFAWGFLAPVGIMLALFYKVVWPNGQWFYAHIVFMVLALVFSLLGVIPIVVHADGLWLSTTATNLPHQVLGITALATVAINPFLAICRCYPSSPWRWIYNTVHGSIGLLLGEGAAFGAMLLGLHIVRELSGVDQEFLHYAIYSMSATVGLIIMMAALFNVYSINYKKNHPTPDDLGVSSEPPTEFLSQRKILDDDEEEEEEEEEVPQDCKCRSCLGIFIVTLLFLATAANITLLALF